MWLAAQAEFFQVKLSVEARFSGDGVVRTVSLDKAKGSICANKGEEATATGYCEAQDELDPCDLFTRAGIDCPDEVSSGDAVALGTLLEAATGRSTFLDEVKDGHTARERGVVLQLLVEFSNARSTLPDAIVYTIRPRVINSTKGNSWSVAQSWPAGTALPAFVPRVRAQATIAAIRVQVDTAADVGQASVSQALVVITSAIGFMTTFQKVLVLLVAFIYVNPDEANHRRIPVCARRAPAADPATLEMVSKGSPQPEQA